MHLMNSNIDKNNFLIVNIWTSAQNKIIPGSNVGHVSLQTKENYMSLWPGIQIRKDNALKTVEKYILRYFGERPPSFKLNYEEDCALEALCEGRVREIDNIDQCQPGEVPYLLNLSTGRASELKSQPPELDKELYMVAIIPSYANVRIVVYKLRIDLLEQAFKERVSKTTGWRLIGSNFISRLADNTPENCASLAYRLLEASGLYKNLEGHSSSENSSVFTPDDLVKHIIEYKDKELKIFPATAKLFKTICPDEASVDNLKALFDVQKDQNVKPISRPT